MRIGLSLPHYDFSFPDPHGLTWAGLREATNRAERLGFDSGWISDHLFLDLSKYGGPDDPRGSMEAFTALAALAPTTKRIRLGTLVACAPFRHPAVTAKMATVVDLVSGGRFELGLGAGWYEREFTAFGYDFPSDGDRVAILEEHARAIAALFGEGPVDVDGRFVRLRGAYNRPRPARPGGPPIWIGSKGGARTLRIVARHAAGWNTVWRWTPEAYAKRSRALDRICEEEGRDPATVRRSLGLYTLVGEDDADVQARFRAMQRWAPGGALDGVSVGQWADGTLTGTPEDCLKRLAEFAGLGVEEVILAPASLPFAVFDWSMVELIAASVLPDARRL